MLPALRSCVDVAVDEGKGAPQNDSALVRDAHGCGGGISPDSPHGDWQASSRVVWVGIAKKRYRTNLDT